MKADFINPFLESILDVLSTMAQIDAKPGRPIIKGDDVACGDVTGIIGMAGEKTKGSLAVSFTAPAICDIANRMLGEDVSEINETVTDLVGEITNMVTGGAKRILGERGYDFGMATPVVVSGKGHVITHKTKGPRILLPFSTEAGEFFVEICFD